MSARFAFRSPKFSVEFKGSEEFVAEQVELVKATIREILSAASGGEVGAVTSADAPKQAGSPLEEFYQQAKTREGRGALQDSILLFAHYVTEHQGKPEFSIEDLNFCFDILHIQRPKSLANTLGILKRDRSWLERGSRRGTYTLTARGREKVSGLLG
jgi:hypothetical protein